jgi:hypothetical protein
MGARPDQSLEEAFHQRMLGLYWRVGELSGGKYWANYFLRGVRKHGGVEAAKLWLAAPHPQDGLGRLSELDLLEESMEYVVSHEHRWRPLFTNHELQIADLRYRLAVATRRKEPQARS